MSERRQRYRIFSTFALYVCAVILYTLEEEMLNRANPSKPSCDIETVSPICPLCKIRDELCGVVGLGR